MKSNTLTMSYRIIMRNERSLAVFFGMLAILFVGMYIYGVIGTTIAVTQRRDLERDIRVANTRISELEIAYFNTISSITLDRAKELGYHEIKNAEFAYVDSASAVALVR